jgi:hypothetical protein
MWRPIIRKIQNFYADNSRTVAFRQMKFGTVKVNLYTRISFILNIILTKLLNIATGQILRLCWDKRWTTLCRIL